MKQIGIWTGVIALIVAIIWGLIAVVNNTTSSPTLANLPPLAKEDIVFGIPENAKVTLTEYADFQCPACRNYFPLVRQLEKDFGDKLLVVYRFFPLTQIHQNAMLSAQAAVAAGKQNKFWEMHDLLFENQSTWADSTNAQNIFTEYAKKLNLDIAQFTNDLNAETTKRFINDQENAGIAIKVNSTPTFFVNGKSIPNPPGYTAFKQIIQDELKQK